MVDLNVCLFVFASRNVILRYTRVKAKYHLNLFVCFLVILQFSSKEIKRGIIMVHELSPSLPGGPGGEALGSSRG